jgi:hypothetical protein
VKRTAILILFALAPAFAQQTSTSKPPQHRSAISRAVHKFGRAMKKVFGGGNNSNTNGASRYSL